MGLGNDRAFRVGPRVLPRRQHRPTLTRRCKESAGWPIADTTGRGNHLTSPVLADKRDQFRRALDCVEPTRRGASPTRRQETTSTWSCPGSPCRKCRGSTRHLLRHPKRGGRWHVRRGRVLPRGFLDSSKSLTAVASESAEYLIISGCETSRNQRFGGSAAPNLK